MDLPIIRRTKKLTTTEQNHLLIRLSRLLEQGYPLVEALYALRWNEKWQRQVDQMIAVLKEGKSIDIALQKADFNNHVISFLFFASAHGDIKQSLKQSVMLIEKNTTIMTKFKQTIRYPFVLFFMFIGLLFFIKTSVYPAFVQLFTSTSMTSNITLFSIRFINGLFAFFSLLLLMLLISLSIWLILQKKAPFETKLVIYQKLYLIRRFIRSYNTFLFALHLSSLLHSGLSLKESLTTLAKQSHYRILNLYSQQLIEHFSKGKHIDTILPTLYFLNNEIVTIFQKNSNVDNLAVDLHGYADHLLEDIEKRIKRIITWIQPVFFVLMAASIIFIYLSLLYPMFQLLQTI